MLHAVDTVECHGNSSFVNCEILHCAHAVIPLDFRFAAFVTAHVDRLETDLVGSGAEEYHGASTLVDCTESFIIY